MKRHISIHALRVEGDVQLKNLRRCQLDFYPRPPGGGRPGARTIVQLDLYHFYPRPPGGGRQKYFYVLNLFFIISIHALRVEGDSIGTCSPRSCRDFYPRPPGGGRLL